VKRSSPSPPATQPQLRECPGCGLLQTVLVLAPGMTAQCVHCATTLRRTSTHRLDHIAALSLTAFNIAGRHVLDAADERANSWYQPHRQSVFGA